jgi:hypothetical protein
LEENSMMRTMTAWLGTALALAAAPHASGDGCWNIAKDFSSVQGQDDWHYGYYDGTAAWAPMTEFGVVANTWTVDFNAPAPLYWTLISANSMHPNGALSNPGKTPAPHQAALRWVSPISGTVHVVTTAKKGDTSGGDGVTYILYFNGGIEQTANIAFNDTTGVTFTQNFTVVPGDTIDFAVSAGPARASAFDSTTYTAVVVVPPGLFGDINVDCAVDGADLGLLLAAWGPCAGCPEDLNGDGEVDGADLGLLLASWT